VARSLRIERQRAPRAQAEPRFDPDIGLLVVTDRGFDVLCAAAAGESADAQAPETQSFTEAGALVSRRVHPALEARLQPALNPVLELVVSRDQDRTRAWLGEDDVCLLVPAEGEWRRLVLVPAPALPELLADLVGLAPRPAPERREPLTATSPQLARLIAEQRGGRPTAQRAGELPDDVRLAVEGLRGHWRVAAHRPGTAQGEMVEVLDASQGLWLVVPQNGEVALLPTDPATVWRHLTRLIAP